MIQRRGGRFVLLAGLVPMIGVIGFVAPIPPAQSETVPFTVVQQHYDPRGQLQPGPYSSRGQIRSVYLGHTLDRFRYSKGAVDQSEPVAGIDTETPQAPSLAAVPDPGRFHLDHWTPRDGLPSNKVRSLYQTDDGFLWIGTENGIARFDGDRFDSFTPSEHEAMKTFGAMGRCFFQDNERTLWVGSNQGLLRLRDRQFQTFVGQEVLAGIRLNDMSPRQSGGFWIATDKGLAQWTGDKIELVPIDGMNEGTRIIQCREIDERLWLGTSHGLWAIDIETTETVDQFLQPGEDIPKLERYDRVGVFELFVDDRATLWVSTDVIGIWQLDLRTRELAQIRDATNGELGSAFPSHARLTQDHLGDVWGAISSYPGGIIHIPSDNRQIDYSRFSNPLGQTFDILVGHSGAIWIASREGLFRLRPIPFTSLSFDGVGRRNGFRSIAETPDGSVWFGSRHAFARWTGNQLSIVDAILAAPEALTTAMGVTPRGQVWSGFPGGGMVSLRNANSPARFSPSFVLRFSEIGELRATAPQAKSGLWIGTEQGVFSFNEETQAIDKIRSSPENVSCLASDPNGLLWIGTLDGTLYRRFGQNTVQVETAGGSPPPNNIASLCAASAETAWIGTGQGLAWATTTNLYLLPPTDGLPTGRTDGIARDHNNNLWISHEAGIARVAEDELLAWTQDPRHPPAIAQFDTRDGILGLQRSAGIAPSNTALTGSDGRVWFAKYAGIMHVDPRRLPQQSPPPQVFIEAIEANGNRVSLTQPVQIPAQDAKLLLFRFTTPSLYAPHKVTLQYRMQHLGDEWHTADSNRTAYYLNLAPGQHLFEVRARNHEGRWSTRPAQLSFTVTPYLWQRGWFQAGVASMLLASIAGLIQRRLRQQRQELNEERLQSLHRERARIARDIHDHLGARLSETALKTPHKESSRDLAEESLSELRNLIWSVDPEQDTLEGFLNFVADFSTRFLGKANIQVELDLPLSPSHQRLPQRMRLDLAAVIKEVLNNVVKHSEAKKVTLRIKLIDSTLSLAIADDGKGLKRPTSAEDVPRHPARSRGLNNIESRIQELGGTINIRSQPTQGTSISLTVPLA